MSRDIRIGTILQSYGEPLTRCDGYVEEDHIQKIYDDGSIVKTAEGHCNCTPDRSVVDCEGYKQFCSIHKNITDDKLDAILEKFATRIKNSFYYEFDELIPSIMSDNIDKIKQEVLDEVHNQKR